MCPFVVPYRLFTAPLLYPENAESLTGQGLLYCRTLIGGTGARQLAFEWLAAQRP